MKIGSRARWSVALVCTVLAACADSAGGDGDAWTPPPPPNGELRLTPEALVLDTTPGEPVQHTYKVERVVNGAWVDVTASASLWLDPEWDGVFEGAVLKANGNIGFATRVRAKMSDTNEELEGTLAVRLVRHIEATNAPAGFDEALDATPTRPIELTYPSSDVLMPPNLWGLPLQWRAPFAGWYRATLGSDVIHFELDTRCEVGMCTVALDPIMLGGLSATFTGYGGEVLWSVRGLADDGSLGESNPFRIELATEPMRGTIYYWVDDPGAIVRKDVDSPHPLETYLDGGSAGGLCVGCHVVSRDGSRIAVGLNAPQPAVLKTYDVAERTELTSSTGNFAAFGPGAAELVRTKGGKLVIERSGAGGMETTDLVDKGTQPDWSPDGASIVFAEITPFAFPGLGDGFPFPFPDEGDEEEEDPGIPGLPGLDDMEQPGYSSGVLKVVRRTPTGWSAPAALLTQPGPNDYYPTFSNDGQWVVFNRSAANASSYAAVDARVMIAPAIGGAPVDLARANGTGSLTNSWPKFAPFVQRHKGKRIAWVTFSSKRSAPGVREGGNQIWVAAVDVEALGAGVDPSYPAYWLPFQDPAKGNHLAQWAERLVKKE